MDLRQQYLEDVPIVKKERIERIIEVAKVEFYKNGISNTKLSTIAKESKVGEASIYRYFTDKISLVELVAVDYWKNQTSVFNTYMADNINPFSNGLSKMKVYTGMFIKLYFNHKGFLKFMEDFDNFSLQSNVKTDDNSFIEYANYIKEVFIKIFEEGITDGSIKPELNKEIAYSFISQTMVSTTQKMSIRLDYSYLGSTEYAINCLNFTIDMFIQYLSNEKAI